MLGQRDRRWVNIKPALDQCLVFAGLAGDHVPDEIHLPCKPETLIQVGLMLGQRRKVQVKKLDYAGYLTLKTVGPQ